MPVPMRLSLQSMSAVHTIDRHKLDASLWHPLACKNMHSYCAGSAGMMQFALVLHPLCRQVASGACISIFLASLPALVGANLCQASAVLQHLSHLPSAKSVRVSDGCGSLSPLAWLTVWVPMRRPCGGRSGRLTAPPQSIVADLQQTSTL